MRWDPGADVSIEISYSSRRSELWSWYWRNWPKKFLPFHAMVTLVICVWSVALWKKSFVTALLIGLCVSAAAIAGMIVYPQLRFSSKLRTLVIDKRGVFSSRGRRSARRTWRQIASIKEHRDFIVMSSKWGALIVPPRAFHSESERHRFLSFAKQAKAEYHSGSRPEDT